MSELTISDHDKQMFADLRRHNLRHPGVVSGRVVKMLRATNVTYSQLGAARTEWLKLGLGQKKGTS